MSGHNQIQKQPANIPVGISKKWTLAIGYLFGSILLGCLGLFIGGFGLWLFWPAVALLLVAANYSIIGARGFGKQPNGQMPIATQLLYLPYTLIMWLNSRLWTRNNNHTDWIAENVYLGRIPSHKVLQQNGFVAVVDLCAELPIIVPNTIDYSLLPVLDLTPLTDVQYQQVAQMIEQANKRGKTLVYCALGYSRSAAAIAAWLVLTKRVANTEQALLLLKKARPSIVLNNIQLD